MSNRRPERPRVLWPLPPSHSHQTFTDTSRWARAQSGMPMLGYRYSVEEIDSLEDRLRRSVQRISRNTGSVGDDSRLELTAAYGLLATISMEHIRDPTWLDQSDANRLLYAEGYRDALAYLHTCPPSHALRKTYKLLNGILDNLPAVAVTAIEQLEHLAHTELPAFDAELSSGTDMAAAGREYVQSLVRLARDRAFASLRSSAFDPSRLSFDVSLLRTSFQALEQSLPAHAGGNPLAVQASASRSQMQIDQPISTDQRSGRMVQVTTSNTTPDGVRRPSVQIYEVWEPAYR